MVPGGFGQQTLSQIRGVRVQGLGFSDGLGFRGCGFRILF